MPLPHELTANYRTCFFRFGGDPPYTRRPILFQENGRPFFNFARSVLLGRELGERSPGLPPLTEEQAEALDLVHFTALKHALIMTLEKGDICFLNNMSCFHGREAFADADREQSKRHIMRIWLRDPARSFKTPPCLQETWDEVYGEERQKYGQWTVEKVHSAKLMTTTGS